MKSFGDKVMKGLAAFLFVSIVGAAYAGGDKDREGYGRGYGPGMMGSGYGSGMMGNAYGPGMMGGGYGSGMMGQPWLDPQANTPQGLAIDRISLEEAKQDVVKYLDSIGNKNLVVEEFMEFDLNFYALVKEKDSGKGAFELLVDPYRGFVGSEPGPNMMWNVKYGPMSWRNKTPDAMAVGVVQAKEIAQSYLDGIGPGFAVEEKPDEFYGYYTAHVLKGDKIVGMLSVNGYTGQVWFHSWHGAFRAMEM